MNGTDIFVIHQQQEANCWPPVVGVSRTHLNHRVHIILAQHMQLVPAFVGGVEQGLAQQFGVVRHDGILYLAFAMLVAHGTDSFGDVEDEQTGKVVVPMGEVEQFVACLLIERGAVGNSEAMLKQAFVDDVVEQVKGVAVHALIGGIITDEGATEIGRDDHSGHEALHGKGAFARTGRAT
jgi:hypothetical protein